MYQCFYIVSFHFNQIQQSGKDITYSPLYIPNQTSSLFNSYVINTFPGPDSFGGLGCKESGETSDLKVFVPPRSTDSTSRLRNSSGSVPTLPLEGGLSKATTSAAVTQREFVWETDFGVNWGNLQRSFAHVSHPVSLYRPVQDIKLLYHM